MILCMRLSVRRNVMPVYSVISVAGVDKENIILESCCFIPSVAARLKATTEGHVTSNSWQGQS
jgi:hypothetical protein